MVWKAIDFISNDYLNASKLLTEAQFHDAFLDKLENTYMNRKCDFDTSLPAEGIVVRIENLLDECQALKLKSFDFLTRESKELDEGIIDMEEQESLPSEEV